MYQNIMNHEFQVYMRDPEAVIIDVRTPEELKSGYIPGTSVFIDFNNEDFREKAVSLNKSKKYLIVCRSGARSAKACKILDELGFDGPFYNLAKGMAEWNGDLKLP